MSNNNQTVKPTIDELKRMELENSIKGAVKDSMTQRLVIKTEKGSLLNNLLLGRKKQTLNMFKVPVAYFERIGKDGPFKKKLKFIKLAESRLTRFFEANQITEEKLRTVPLNNGEVIDATAEYTYNELVGSPIIFMEFEGKPMFNDPMQFAAYEECKKIIWDGLTWGYQGETISTEYAQSSASEMRTLKGVFVRKDFKFSDEYLAKFQPADDTEEEKAEFEAFMKIMRELRGAEVLYTAMSYGGYLREYKGHKDSPAKFMARMGMSQTSTKSLGNDFRVKCIGEIKFPWTDEIEQAHVDYYAGLVDKNGTRLHSDKTVERIVAKIKDLWKEEKEDGQNLVTDEAIIRGYRRLGIKLKPEQVIGKLVQARVFGASKGTFLVVPKAWFGIPALPDGTHPYADYDVVVEKSSLKFTPWAKYWCGDLAPEFELVAISKQKYSNNMNYQGWLALDGGENTVAKIMGLIDARYAFQQEAMLNSEIAKAVMGVKSTQEDDLDDVLDIDDYERSLTTILAKALDACDDIIYDRSYRMKFMNRTLKMRDKMGYGKVPVEGANRFVISDPTAFFRTDLAVPRLNKDGSAALDYEGNPMFDIVITSMDQSAIRNIVGAYWNNNEKEAVLFRSPCVHPGEPQRVQLVGLDSIPEKIETAYGDLNIRELFETIKDIVVVNCFSFTLDALGGADTDGDTVLVITEPTIVELRSLRRAPMLIKIDSETFKTTITPESVKKYMIDSLEDAGIGRITNWATTWRDIELMIVHMPNPVDGKYRLPKNVKSALEDMAKEARKVLKISLDKLDPVEKAAAEATAAMQDINDDKKFGEWAKLVIYAAEANIELTRKLQETSINTAKSGVFVEFDKYPWLKLKIRATWHRPWAEDTFDSWSTMGRLSTYANEKWTKLREWAAETSKPLNIGSDLDWPSYREVYRAIRELKASYGTAIYDLNKKSYNADDDGEELGEKDRMNAYKELGVYYNSILRRIAVELGSVDAVSAMVYRATNDRDKDTDEGLSFVWQCWGEEFVHTLRHMNSGKSSKRLVVVRMAKEYEDKTLPAGDYIVYEGGVRFPSYPEDIVAYAKVPNGSYELISFDETPYLLVDVVKKTVESMAATFKGVKFRVIGFKYQMFEGEVLTRNKVKELLAQSDYTITVVGGESGTEDGRTYVDALVTVNIPGHDEPICIGNIPSGGSKNEESGYFAQALHDKVIRVIIPKEADKTDINRRGEGNRLLLEIVEILEDLAISK